MNEYDKQAEDFLEKTGSELTIEYLRHAKYWPADTDSRDIYRFTLTNKDGQQYSSEFGQSIIESRSGATPSAYDILACLSGYEPPNDLQDFCLEFGYEVKQIREAQRAFEAVQKEYTALADMYTPEELEMLNEIS
jgi:hypothetical protein